MTRLKDSLILAVGLVAIVIIVASVQQNRWASTSLVHADSSQNVAGYAWSSNIGWISFNCSNNNSCGTSNYGVNINNGGNFSGYAWSSIGWISFNENSGCPEAGCVTHPKFDKSSGVVTGWARACAGTVNGNCTGGSRSDGWDGWIKLSGTTPSGSAYAPTLSEITFAGYSWGSDVIGWISWSGPGYGVVSPSNVICTSSISVVPDTIEQGGNVALTWSVSGGTACASSCSGSGFNTGGATSGNNVPPTILPVPPSTSYALTCSGGLYGSPPPANTTVTVLSPETTITVNEQSGATRVDPTTANNVGIAWSSTHATSCAITKNNAAWRSGLNQALPGISDSVTNQTIYKIDCVNNYGTHSTDTVIVNVLSGFKEF